MEGQPTSDDAPVTGPAATTREVMTREFVGVSESDSLAGAAMLLRQEGATTAVVLRGREPVGTLTAGDALAHVADQGNTHDKVAAAMSEEVPTVGPATDLSTVAGRLAEADVDSLLVEDGDELAGVVSRRDVVSAMASMATRPEPGPAEADGRADETPADADEYATQSVCEACGSLTPSLRDFNGQLVCADCRDV